MLLLLDMCDLKLDGLGDLMFIIVSDVTIWVSWAVVCVRLSQVLSEVPAFYNTISGHLKSSKGADWISDVWLFRNWGCTQADIKTAKNYRYNLHWWWKKFANTDLKSSFILTNEGFEVNLQQTGTVKFCKPVIWRARTMGGPRKHL